MIERWDQLNSEYKACSAVSPLDIEDNDAACMPELYELLDAVFGKPASGVVVTLEGLQSEGRWFKNRRGDKVFFLNTRISRAQKGSTEAYYI